MTAEKNELQKKIKDGDDLRKENTEKRKNIENANNEKKKIDDEIDKIQKKNRELDAAKKQIENMPDVSASSIREKFEFVMILDDEIR